MLGLKIDNNKPSKIKHFMLRYHNMVEKTRSNIYIQTNNSNIICIFTVCGKKLKSAKHFLFVEIIETCLKATQLIIA